MFLSLDLMSDCQIVRVLACALIRLRRRNLATLPRPQRPQYRSAFASPQRLTRFDTSKRVMVRTWYDVYSVWYDVHNHTVSAPFISPPHFFFSFFKILTNRNPAPESCQPPGPVHSPAARAPTPHPPPTGEARRNFPGGARGRLGGRHARMPRACAISSPRLGDGIDRSEPFISRR